VLVRYGYVPAMLLGMNGLAVYLIAAGYPLWIVGPLALVAIGLSFLVEHILPYEPEWNHAHHDAGKDVAHGVVYEIANMNAILLLPLITMFIPWEGIWPRELPLWLQLATAVVVADFCMTMIHYFSHKTDWLWRLHAIHHGVHRLYGFNGLVRHPLHQTLDLAFGTLPLILAGLPVDVAVLLGFAISVQLLVQHSNTDYALGPFKHVLAIGPVHRLHHVNWTGEGDVNFGLFFNFWDRMLGTFRLAAPVAPVAGDIGIDGRPYFPQSYLRQLVLPFLADQNEGAMPPTTGQPATAPKRPAQVGGMGMTPAE